MKIQNTRLLEVSWKIYRFRVGLARSPLASPRRPLISNSSSVYEKIHIEVT